MLASLFLVAHQCINLVFVDDVGLPIDVTVKCWDQINYIGSDDMIQALSNEILRNIREVAQLNTLFRESLQLFPVKIDVNDAFNLVNFAASNMTGQFIAGANRLAWDIKTTMEVTIK